MSRDSGPLPLSHHCQFSVIIPSPFSGGIKIDLLWTTKAVHRVVHLHAFPAMIVVILIKDEIHGGPAGGKERVVTLFVRHVHQLINLSPVVPLKALIEF